MDKVVNFVLICTLTVVIFCLVFVIMDIIDNKINKIYNNAQIVEPFMTLGDDLRGYELRKDTKKYWILTNKQSQPVVIDVTYETEF